MATFSVSLIIASVVLTGGIALLWLGIRGRRVGCEQRCRKCNYNLTGATSQVCPECGATIDHHGVVFGTRRRRPVMIMLALFFILTAAIFGGLEGYRRLQAINKYRYYPVTWLMNSARGGDLQAITELECRLQANKLSDEQVQSIIATALTEQSASTTTPLTQTWINMLDHLDQGGQLTTQQQRQYFDQIITYALAVRPIVRVGEPIPVLVQYHTRGPDPYRAGAGQDRCVAFVLVDYYFQKPNDDHARLRNTPKTVHEERYRSINNPVSGPHSTALTAMNVDLVPGTYLVVCVIEHQVFATGVADPFSNLIEPVHTREVQLTTELEALPADAPDTVELVDDPSIAQQIKDAVHFDRPLRYIAKQVPRGEAHVTASIKSGAGTPSRSTLPMDVAFDVYVRTNDGEWPLGSFVLRARANQNVLWNGSIPTLENDTVELVLRPSPEAARRTVNVVRIWDGELVFENVPVGERPK